MLPPVLHCSAPFCAVWHALLAKFTCCMAQHLDALLQMLYCCSFINCRLEKYARARWTDITQTVLKWNGQVMEPAGGVLVAVNTEQGLQRRVIVSR